MQNNIYLMYQKNTKKKLLFNFVLINVNINMITTFGRMSIR